jgi:phosphoglycolate phosphatase-like HAD superfamily hydrolase
MPELVRVAQAVYVRRAPDLRRKVCPGVRRLLASLKRRGAVMGLVTGNLTRIGWKKMERAGLKPYFRYGAFAELAATRAGLVGLALREARLRGWIDRRTPVALIGDHPNDVCAAHANGVRSIAVATGLSSAGELLAHEPYLVVEDLRALPVEVLFSL